MVVAGEVTRHGRAHPYSWSISIVSLRSKESEGGAIEVSKTKLLSVRILTAWLQGIQPCKLKGKGHQLIG